VRNVMGTGPFRLVEHVAGSHWSGERFKDYFKPGLPYLDGFKAAFTQGAALINALQGGQIMADFRSVTTADRDRLVAALGDKIIVQESPWLNVLLVTFNTQNKPFDDPRVRRALSLAIDRWKASEVLRRSSIMRYVGAYLRPGSALAARDEDLVTMPGFSKDITAARQAPARRGRRTGPQSSPHQPDDLEFIHAGRHLHHRPVAPDRRRDRACAGERDALQQLHERRHVRCCARLPGRFGR
jgi:peptide/nickel transport system substrate-binding protein